MPLSPPLATLAVLTAILPAHQSGDGTLLRPFHPGQMSRPVQRPQAEIALANLPDDMLRIMQDADWPNPRRTAGALGVTRVGLPLRQCRQPADSIDLRRIRANGFRVVSYRLIDSGAPSGYRVAGYSNVRPFLHVSATSDRLVNAHDPAEIDTIGVSPQTWVLDVPAHRKIQRLGCTAGWTLAIRVTGPAGIDPYSGRAR